MLRAARRDEYERRYWALVEGDENFGVKMTWVGKTEKPKSDWDYDYSERDQRIQHLGELAELLAPIPKVDERTASLGEWNSLMRQRRGLTA